MITTEIEYIARRKMWRVTVWRDGVFVYDAWFHTENGANIYAAEARLGG